MDLLFSGSSNMKFLLLIVLLGTATATDDKASRRLSYSSQIVHDNPKYPNQQASSSVNFKLDSDSKEIPMDVSGSNADYSSFVYSHTTPKTMKDYAQDYYKLASTTQAFYNSQPTYTPVQYKKTATQVQPSQSFNVGYSMSFKNNKEPPKATKYEDGDIITGSPKEEVKRPGSVSDTSASFLGEDFVRNSFIDSKKQKISGIKTKYTKTPQLNINTKQLLAQANLSPKTQKHLAFLDNIKSTPAKFLTEGRNNQASLAAGSPWQNLSPTVEIYQSKELTSAYSQDAKTFDHSRALGKSEGFDHTNAIDFSNVQTAKLTSTPIFAAKTAEFYKPQISFDIKTTHPYTPLYKSNPSQVSVPKLPIDTSLLRDPYLTTDKHAQVTNSKSIPIHFDTSLIQEMNKHITNSNLRPSNDDDTSSQYSEDSYKGIDFKQPISVLKDQTGQLSKQNEQYHAQYSTVGIAGTSSQIAQNLGPTGIKHNQKVVGKFGFKPPGNPYKPEDSAQAYGFEEPKQLFPQPQPLISQPLFDHVNSQISDDLKQQHKQKYPSFEQLQQQQPIRYEFGKDGKLVPTYAGTESSSTKQHVYRPEQFGHYNAESTDSAVYSKPYKQQQQQQQQQNHKAVKYEFPVDSDPMKDANRYKDLVNSKDYDFQKEFDKLLFSQEFNQNGEYHKGPNQNQQHQQHQQQQQQHGGHNKHHVHSHNHYNNNNNKNQPQQQQKIVRIVHQNHQKRENQYPRQSRNNHGTRSVRHHADDLRPPPIYHNNNNNNNGKSNINNNGNNSGRHRRIQRFSNTNNFSVM